MCFVSSPKGFITHSWRHSQAVNIRKEEAPVASLFTLVNHSETLIFVHTVNIHTRTEGFASSQCDPHGGRLCQFPMSPRPWSWTCQLLSNTQSLRSSITRFGPCPVFFHSSQELSDTSLTRFPALKTNTHELQSKYPLPTVKHYLTSEPKAAGLTTN